MEELIALPSDSIISGFISFLSFCMYIRQTSTRQAEGDAADNIKGGGKTICRPTSYAPSPASNEYGPRVDALSLAVLCCQDHQVHCLNIDHVGDGNLDYQVQAVSGVFDDRPCLFKVTVNIHRTLSKVVE